MVRNDSTTVNVNNKFLNRSSTMLLSNSFPAVVDVPAVDFFRVVTGVHAVAGSPVVAFALLLMKFKKNLTFRLSDYDYQTGYWFCCRTIGLSIIGQTIGLSIIGTRKNYQCPALKTSYTVLYFFLCG